MAVKASKQAGARDMAMRRVVTGALAGAACLATGALHPATAGSAEVTAGADNAAGSSTSFWQRPTMLGDIGGLRTILGNDGISLNLTETSEVLGNVSGGLKQGFTYDGLTTLTVGLDTQKAFGWQGGSFNISVLQIHGRNLSQYYLDNLQTASGIEAPSATRLWEAWYQQAFPDDRFDIKVGQQSIDQEFITSIYSALFVNTMMGWPTVPSYDMYAGGPAYPLSSLGVRFRAQSIGNFTFLAGVFDDNPPGGAFANDSQLRGAERTGTRFNMGTGALGIAELQYAINQPSAGDTARDQAPGLPGTYKLGLWYDTAPYNDQRIDNTGLSLADPASSGTPMTRRRNFSIYGVFDQMIWRPDPKSGRSIGIFARIMGAPGDRNLVDFSTNAGVVMKAPFSVRESDSVGLGYGIAKISPSARALDQDIANASGSAYPVRGSEQFIELTYQAQITPWWQIQPDFQYVFSPGAGASNPNNPTKRLGDEAILGVRTNITF